MKTKLFSKTAALCQFLLSAAVLSPAPTQAELTVHEWGTFTVLYGSDGIPLRWYQAYQDQFSLPAFVHRPSIIGKALGDGRALARMETPVLYFYPTEEMNVSVKASLQSGGLSEWFPSALRVDQQGVPLGNPNGLQWIGRLFPPDSTLAKQIPYTKDEAGRHYDAARNVPEAWLFQSSLPNISPPPANPAVAPSAPGPQVDRLIFYRGAADVSMPAGVFTEDDKTFSLRATGEQPISTLIAVQNTNEGIAWIRIENLQPARWEQGVDLNSKRFTFPAPSKSEEAIPALRQAVTESLVKEGLTMAEAAAMVATWQDLWFSETGTRVLAMLPREWVERTVPLQIAPTPTKLERVYVARLEILTHAREDGLLALLMDQSTPQAAWPKLKDLGFGRFTQGALDRAEGLAIAKLRMRFAAMSSVKSTASK